MSFKLRDHQKAALKRMRNGCILNGSVGSGKSLTSLAYFYIRICGGSLKTWTITKPKDLYIITTAMKRDKKEWPLECAQFGLNEGPNDNGINVRVDSWNNIRKYADVKGAFFIFDEQRAVGKGVWAKTFIHIAKRNQWILLTATPGDNFMDYCPVFIANGFYKNRTQFYIRHVVWSSYTDFPKIDHYIDEEYLEKLKNHILIKMDVKRKTSHHKILEYVEYDKKLYYDVSKDKWNIYDDKPIENPPQYMSIIRKIVNSDPTRCDKVLSIMKDHSKVIIFYNFDYERIALINMANDNEILIKEWNGHNHQTVPEGNTWIYLVQYNAGSEGWECTDTDTIIFYSLSYSYRMITQAAGRIDRRNTKFKDLYYYYLVSESLIDKEIMKALKNKKDFNEKKFLKEEVETGQENLY